MKIDSIIEAALNEQMKHEFESAYAYLSLATDLGATPYSGFAHWMKKQYEEELEHAMRIYKYIQERQGRVKLQSFECPNYNVQSPLEAFQIAYKLEVENTERIHKAFALAVQQKDYSTEIFLQWFISEQVEEEDNCQTMIGALELAKDCSSSLLALDREATQR